MLCWQNRCGDLSTIKTLFYHVFKSKYFPIGTIFDAKKIFGVVCLEKHFEGEKVISMGYQMENRGLSVHKGI